MKSILLIGLGRFGRHIAVKLHELHHQVMAVDEIEERVNAVLPYVTNAQIGDSKNEEFLSELTGNHFPAEGAGREIRGRPRQPGCAREIPAAQRRG